MPRTFFIQSSAPSSRFAWERLGEMMGGLSSVLLALALGACVGAQTPERRHARATKLSGELRALDRSVDGRDADLLATTAVEKSAELTQVYKPLPVPWLNNNLVNSGFRLRGLCWHWRDDLFPHLYKLQLRTLDLHLATAKRGSVFEHNAIVVTAGRRPFSEGVVLDPWRSGGLLSWAKVSADRYPWEPLAPELTPDSLRPLFKRR